MKNPLEGVIDEHTYMNVTEIMEDAMESQVTEVGSRCSH
jgi:hypothetical protein